jgi:hypothetical protein
MVEIIGICLALLTGLFVAYPLLQKRQQRVSFADNHRAEELEARKAEIYAAIKDIDFDFQMGKLSKEDYEQLRSQYKSEAVGLLKRIDQAHGKRKDDGGARAGADRPGSAKFCHQCGQPLSSSDKFCSSCGEKV